MPHGNVLSWRRFVIINNKLFLKGNIALLFNVKTQYSPSVKNNVYLDD